MPEMTKEEKERRDALMAITALRQLDGLKLLSYDERESIKSKIMGKYNGHFDMLRDEQPERHG